VPGINFFLGDLDLILDFSNQVFAVYFIYLFIYFPINLLFFIHLVFLVISKSKSFPPFFVTDSRKQEEAKIQVQAQSKDNIDIKIINIPWTITIVY